MSYRGHRDTKANLRTFDTRLQNQVNHLSQVIYHKDIVPDFTPPAEYTGEHLGVQYLYKQSGENLCMPSEDLEKQIDEGFEDFQEDPQPQEDVAMEAISYTIPEDEDTDSDKEESVSSKSECMVHDS